MRVYCVAIVAGVFASTGASASSFVTLPARDEAVSPSFVYLGGATPVVAEAPSPSAPVQTALAYPAPLSAALVAAAPLPAPPQATEPPQIALHYPAPFPGSLRTPNASAPITQVSASVIAMGEPEIEYFKVAAIAPKAPPTLPPNFSPMVMRGGILGDGVARTFEPASGQPSDQPQQASVREEKPKPVPRDAPPPPPPAAAPPPPPPKGLGPLRGVQ